MRNEFDIRTEKLMIREAAFTEGKAEGKAEGIAEGEARGKAEGRAETKLEMARKMIADGLERDVVAKYTGLSEEEFATI